MQILRVTDAPGEYPDRLIYGVLEAFHSYTLYECKGRDQISLGNPAQTVVLDNLHLASAPSRIINQIIQSSKTVDRLILVDQQEDQEIQTPEGCSVDHHFVLVNCRFLPQSFSQKRDYYFDPADAVITLLNLTKAA
jgi:hypothetical protein